MFDKASPGQMSSTAHEVFGAGNRRLVEIGQLPRNLGVSFGHPVAQATRRSLADRVPLEVYRLKFAAARYDWERCIERQ